MDSRDTQDARDPDAEPVPDSQDSRDAEPVPERGAVREAAESALAALAHAVPLVVPALVLALALGFAAHSDDPVTACWFKDITSAAGPARVRDGFFNVDGGGDAGDAPARCFPLLAPATRRGNWWVEVPVALYNVYVRSMVFLAFALAQVVAPPVHVLVVNAREMVAAVRGVAWV